MAPARLPVRLLAVGVVAAFFLLVEAFGLGLICAILRLAVRVVGFVVGDFVGVRGVCGCGIFSDDHPHHPSVCCLAPLPSSSTYLKRGGGMMSPWRRRVWVCLSVGILVTSTPVCGS